MKAVDTLVDTDTTEVVTEDGTEQTEESTDQDDTVDQDDADTFDRAYVETLRRESAGYRDRLRTAEARVDELSNRLHTALVAATGRLQDPSDIPYAVEHLDDSAALTAAIDTLLEQKPHLRSRRVVGSVGQGVQSSQGEPVTLGSLLRARV